MREELTLHLAELEKQYKLRQIIIDNFIPPVEVEVVKKRAEYEEEENTWKLSKYKLEPIPRPIATKGAKRPITKRSLERAKAGQVRYMVSIWVEI